MWSKCKKKKNWSLIFRILTCINGNMLKEVCTVGETHNLTMTADAMVEVYTATVR